MIHDAMLSSQEGYVSAVIDSIEFDLERKLTEDKCQAVEKFVDSVITAGFNTKDVKSVARAALDYIDAIPKDVVATLPAMPGFDRDWAENVLDDAVANEPEQTAELTKAQLIQFAEECKAKLTESIGKSPFPQIEGELRKSLSLVEIALAGLTGELMRTALDDCSDVMDTDCVMDARGISYDDAAAMTRGATALHDALLQWDVK
jgi:hypothetical protein